MRGFASHVGAAHRSEDRGDDLIAQGEQGGNGSRGQRRDDVAAGSAGFVDELFAAQLAQVVAGLAEAVAGVVVSGEGVHLGAPWRSQYNHTRHTTKHQLNTATRQQTGGNFGLSVGDDRHRDHEFVVRAIGRLEKSLPAGPLSRLELVTHFPVVVPAKLGVRHKSVSHSELRHLYGRAAVVAVGRKPNLHISGATVVVEAMACERPVVVTATQATRSTSPTQKPAFSSPW